MRHHTPNLREDIKLFYPMGCDITHSRLPYRPYITGYRETIWRHFHLHSWLANKCFQFPAKSKSRKNVGAKRKEFISCFLNKKLIVLFKNLTLDKEWSNVNAQLLRNPLSGEIHNSQCALILTRFHNCQSWGLRDVIFSGVLNLSRLVNKEWTMYCCEQ